MLVCAIGIEVAGHPVAGVLSLPLQEVFRLNHHDPAPFLLDPSTPPTLAPWGESDEIVDVAHGRAYARRIPDATFGVLHRVGHVPQLVVPGQPRITADHPQATAEPVTAAAADEGPQ